MATFLDNWVAFVRGERDRFENRDNNIVGFAFGKITRSYQFLQIILRRQEEGAAAFLDNTEQTQRQMRRWIQEEGPGAHAMTDDEIALSDKGAELSLHVHLDTETFYLHAKILLDNVARAIELYFGPVRGLALDSHDDLTKRITEYAAARRLGEPSRDLLEVVKRLKQDISDYRDYQISHEKSPRTMKGTVFTIGDPRSLRLLSNQLYPTPKDTQTESRALHQLLSDIEMYLEALMRWVPENHAQTARDLLSPSNA